MVSTNQIDKNTNENKRNCNDCQQCCILFEVDSIDKKERENCPFLEHCVGCKIYNNRPSGCRNFYCTWIQGLGKYDDNPKLCGVLIQHKETNLMHKGTKLNYVAWETKKDGFKSESGLQALAQVSNETNSKIMMLDLNNNKLISLCIGDEVK